MLPNRVMSICVRFYSADPSKDVLRENNCGLERLHVHENLSADSSNSQHLPNGCITSRAMVIRTI